MGDREQGKLFPAPCPLRPGALQLEAGGSWPEGPVPCFWARRAACAANKKNRHRVSVPVAKLSHPCRPPNP